MPKPKPNSTTHKSPTTTTTSAAESASTGTTTTNVGTAPVPAVSICSDNNTNTNNNNSNSVAAAAAAATVARGGTADKNEEFSEQAILQAFNNAARNRREAAAAAAATVVATATGPMSPTATTMTEHTDTNLGFQPTPLLFNNPIGDWDNLNEFTSSQQGFFDYAANSQQQQQQVLNTYLPPIIPGNVTTTAAAVPVWVAPDDAARHQQELQRNGKLQEVIDRSNQENDYLRAQLAMMQQQMQVQQMQVQQMQVQHQQQEQQQQQQQQEQAATQMTSMEPVNTASTAPATSSTNTSNTTTDSSCCSTTTNTVPMDCVTAVRQAVEVLTTGRTTEPQGTGTGKMQPVPTSFMCIGPDGALYTLRRLNSGTSSYAKGVLANHECCIFKAEFDFANLILSLGITNANLNARVKEAWSAMLRTTMDKNGLAQIYSKNVKRALKNHDDEVALDALHRLMYYQEKGYLTLAGMTLVPDSASASTAVAPLPPPAPPGMATSSLPAPGQYDQHPSVALPPRVANNNNLGRPVTAKQRMPSSVTTTAMMVQPKRKPGRPPKHPAQDVDVVVVAAKHGTCLDGNVSNIPSSYNSSSTMLTNTSTTTTTVAATKPPGEKRHRHHHRHQHRHDHRHERHNEVRGGEMAAQYVQNMPHDNADSFNNNSSSSSSDEKDTLPPKKKIPRKSVESTSTATDNSKKKTKKKKKDNKTSRTSTNPSGSIDSPISLVRQNTSATSNPATAASTTTTTNTTTTSAATTGQVDLALHDFSVYKGWQNIHFIINPENVASLRYEPTILNDVYKRMRSVVREHPQVMDLPQGASEHDIDVALEWIVLFDAHNPAKFNSVHGAAYLIPLNKTVDGYSLYKFDVDAFKSKILHSEKIRSIAFMLCLCTHNASIVGLVKHYLKYIPWEFCSKSSTTTEAGDTVLNDGYYHSDDEVVEPTVLHQFEMDPQITDTTRPVDN
jgi:hypothetical protein